MSFAGPADSYVDTSVASDTMYTYELVARNVAGASPAAHTFVTTPVNANWTRIGAAFPPKEGPGLNVELRALPIDGRIVLLPPDPEGSDKNDGK